MTNALSARDPDSAWGLPRRNSAGGMVIELAGCSGAGKSTLLEEILRLSRERNVAVVSVAQALLRWVPQGIARRPALQNLLLDCGGGYRQVVDRRRYRSFLAFARRTLMRDADRWLRALNAYRGVLRAVGVHAALSGDTPTRQVVIVDEGTVNAVHAVLVHVAHPPRSADVEAFCRLVPMPDVVVHVTAPLEVVLARTARRRDPPLRNRSRGERERFIRHAHVVFQRLIEHEAFSQNTLRVSCDGDDRHQYRLRAREIVERIA